MARTGRNYGSPKIHTMTNKVNGQVYEVRKMRTADSFNLSVYHYRMAGEGYGTWRSLNADTLAQARKELHA